jgi:hypothetical protein
MAVRGMNLLVLCLLPLFSGREGLLRGEEAAGPVDKDLLLKVYREWPGEGLWKNEWKSLRQMGDIFPAAAEMLRENEKQPEDRWGIGMNREWGFAFNLLHQLGLEGDSRVGPLFMPYLKRPFQPALPEHPDRDVRWTESHMYMVKANDPEGCRYIRERLRGSEATPEEKSWMLGFIENFGSPEWIPILKTLKLTPAELASDKQLVLTLKVTVDKLEKRSTGEKGPSTPPAGAGPSPGIPVRSPGSASDSPLRAVPAAAPAQPGNAVPSPATSSSSSPAWLRPVVAALFLCVLIAGVAVLLRRRAWRR